MTTTELMEFSQAIARSIDAMHIAYGDHPQLLAWVRELMADAIGITGTEKANQLKQEVWCRMRRATRLALHAAASEKRWATAQDPLRPPTPRRQKAA